MRALQQRGCLAGLDRAFHASWLQLSSIQTDAALKAETSTAGVQTVADGTFLHLLSQSFMPSSNVETSPSARPLLANQHAAAELLAQAVSQTAGTQPLYDLSTYLETLFPQAGVRPRNPGYDWRTWARNRLPPPYTPTEKSYDYNQQHEEFLALLVQMDSHMQLPASRETLAKIAKLELVHLWYRQQQQQHVQGGGVSGHESGGRGAPEEAPVVAAGRRGGDVAVEDPQGGGRQEQGSRVGDAASQPTPASPDVTSTAAVGVAADLRVPDDDQDDIFAAADRKARARMQQQQQQQQQDHEQLLLQHAAARDPMSALPPDVQLRLREVQRRAEAYGRMKGGSLAGVVRDVGEAFGQRVSYVQAARGSAGADGSDNLPMTGHVLSGGARLANGMEGRQMANPADALLRHQGTSGPSSPYWAEHPLLSYQDSVVALAVRHNAARRLELASGQDGKASLAAAVASLSASRPRTAAQPVSTPVLTLLLDYLRIKYLDVLHSWEVAARLQEATERADSEAAQERATVTVQAGSALPATVREQLSGSWSQAAASFRPDVVLGSLLRTNDGAIVHTGAEPAVVRQATERALAAPLDWSRAEALLEQEARRAAAYGKGPKEAGAAASGSATAQGDLAAAVQLALAPVLAAAAERHRALLVGQSKTGDASDPLSVTATGAGTLARPAAPQPASNRPAAEVVCFKESLVLDASSAFEDSTPDCRVTLEFDVDRLAASEPSLGGAWGVRFLERLLSLPEQSGCGRGRQSSPGGSMAGRARRGAAARSALLTAVYPVDVEGRFCGRTRTASLTTGRYTSREANRKLLLEHYAALLRATALAAAGSGGQPPQ